MYLLQVKKGDDIDSNTRYDMKALETAFISILMIYPSVGDVETSGERGLSMWQNMSAAKKMYKEC